MRGGSTFVPLTLSAADTADMRTAATATDTAAAECWTTLLADCDGPARRVLPTRLRELVEVTATYAGPAWWFSDGSPHRGRVTEAQLHIEEALRCGDGEDFAEAFGCFDHALAQTVVCAPRRTLGPAHVPAPRTA